MLHRTEGKAPRNVKQKKTEMSYHERLTERLLSRRFLFRDYYFYLVSTHKSTGQNEMTILS